MSEETKVAAFDLAAHFPDIVTADTRQGYSGFIVQADHLLEVAEALRDQHGYDYLSAVTGVDYLPEGKMETVYHFYKMIGGPELVLKVQVPRDDAVIPSLTPLYPGAELQEREAWDLLGIQYSGHPDLCRILTWEGFAGHPLRKDWTEAYFEEEVKPFKSRWPEGHVTRAEDTNPFKDNVKYPHGFDPETWTPEAETALYASLKKIDRGDDLETDQFIVNLGPQHPSTHGVFRMVAIIDGETIVDIKPVMGYLHRNHEKIGERNTFSKICRSPIG